jgi:hypothetical protein
MMTVPLYTEAMISAIARGYGQVRDYDGDGNKLPEGKTRVHAARDIYLPPGSAIYLPFPMVVQHWTTSNSGGDETMGLVLAAKDDLGRTWRFVHLAVATAQKQLVPGMRVAAGTLIGHTTSREYLGQNSKSHLHLDLAPPGVTDKSKFIDPIPVLGVMGFNRMVSGSALGPAAPIIKTVAKALLAFGLGAGAFIGWAKFMRGRAPRLPS